MSLSKFTKDIAYIEKQPNVVKDQATALKQTFDKAGLDIQEYINDVLTEELDTNISTLDSENVKLTGNQTIADVKTFTSSPIVPTPTTDMQASTKKYVDDADAALQGQITSNDTDISNLQTADTANVKLTGNQTVAGVKTFSSSPVVPTPTTTGQASTKGYVDSSIAGVVLGQIPDDSLTEAKMANEMKKGIVGGVESYDDALAHKAEKASDDVHGLKKDGVILTLAANQSIPSGEETAKIWEYASYYKTPSKVLFDLSNCTRITINSDDVKKVRLTANIQWNYDNSEQGYRSIQIKKNNALFVGGQSCRDKSVARTMFQQIQTSIISVSKNDYFEVMITQDAGISQIVAHGIGGQTGTWFELEVIE